MMRPPQQQAALVERENLEQALLLLRNVVDARDNGEASLQRKGGK